MPNTQLFLHIDFRSGLPIYTQIVDQIRAQVAGGVLQPGDQLPTVRALAEELQVNFNTVARAYRILDQARIISTQQGRGTYITEIPPPKVSARLRKESLEALTNRFIEEAVRLGSSKTEITRMIRERLEIWKESGKTDNT